MHHVVQGLWIGGTLSPIEVLCIRSFQHHGHEFHLYAYGPLKNVPDGTVLKDANEILPESAIFRARQGHLSAFADFFRWTLLAKHGGLWVDMDMVCLRPFDFADDIVFGLESEDTVNNAVLGFPAGHFMATVMMKACDDVNLFQPIDSTKAKVKKVLRRTLLGKEKSRRYTRFTEPGGPVYFTKFLRHYGLFHLAKRKWPSVFAPNSEAEHAVEGSYAVHLWNNAIDCDPYLDKSNPQREGTLFGKLAKRYL